MKLIKIQQLNSSKKMALTFFRFLFLHDKGKADFIDEIAKKPDKKDNGV